VGQGSCTVRTGSEVNPYRTVMAGLVPAIHVLRAANAARTSMP